VAAPGAADAAPPTGTGKAAQATAPQLAGAPTDKPEEAAPPADAVANPQAAPGSAADAAPPAGAKQAAPAGTAKRTAARTGKTAATAARPAGMAATPAAKAAAAAAASSAPTTPAPQSSPPGEWRLDGYVEEGEAGEDSAGHVVVRARHQVSGTPVVITYLAAAEAADFREAAEGLSGLESPYVARLYAYVEDGPHAAVIRQAVDGVALDVLLADGGARPGAEAALTVLKGSLLGLAAAEEVGLRDAGYVPSKVLVSAGGGVRLADLGVAAGGTEATGVQAAVAAFSACLAGGAELHPDVQALVAQPAPGARDFAAEVEAAAVAAYGEEWEARGQYELAALVAPLLARPAAEPLPVAVPPTESALPFTFVPDDAPGEGGGLRRRTKVLLLAVAAAVVAGALTVAAVATGSSNDAAATVTTTPSATATTTSAPAAAPATTAPAPTTAPPTTPATTPATKRPKPRPTKAATTRPPVPTKPAAPAGPHVTAVTTTLACVPGNNVARAVVRVEYDGAAGGTLHLVWWRNVLPTQAGAAPMDPQTVKLPQGATSYVFTSNFTYRDGGHRPFIGVTASTDPAAANGSSSQSVRCR
jgi:hypothetical protein